MRVFSANDEFPVDIYNHRGNMKCKARQELCRTDGLPDRDALTSALATSLECASMRHAPVSISFSTRDLLSFFSFRAHLLGGGTRPPERTRLNSAVRHQLGSRFVLPWDRPTSPVARVAITHLYEHGGS